MLDQLAAARRRGESFGEAWPSALSAALTVVPAKWERNEWAHVLSGMTSTWAEAYLRVPAGKGERALAAVAQDPDREPLGDRESVAA
jgi:hypothetical protein